MHGLSSSIGLSYYKDHCPEHLPEKHPLAKNPQQKESSRRIHADIPMPRPLCDVEITAGLQWRVHVCGIFVFFPIVNSKQATSRLHGPFNEGLCLL